MTGETRYSKRLDAATGEWVETTRYFVDKAEVTAEVFVRLFPDHVFRPGERVIGHSSAGWPMESQALAVHADQVAEANARNARHGVATRYKKCGTAVIPDRGDRRKLIKLEGYRDNSGGYGDG